jgi:tryptophanyl-tRNA synthetase
VDPEEIEKEYADAGGYATFKQDVGEAVIEMVAPVQDRYGRLRIDEAGLRDALAAGAEKARSIASETLELVRERMGIRPRR